MANPHIFVDGDYQTYQSLRKTAVWNLVKALVFIADLQITVWVKPGLIHQYDMRARWGVMDFEKRFTKWQRIMKNQKYICLAGSFMFRENKVENGKVQERYAWIFEKMKSKQGCDSYFDSCTPTYQKYLQEKAREKMLRG